MIQHFLAQTTLPANGPNDSVDWASPTTAIATVILAFVTAVLAILAIWGEHWITCLLQKKLMFEPAQALHPGVFFRPHFIWQSYEVARDAVVTSGAACRYHVAARDDTGHEACRLVVEVRHCGAQWNGDPTTLKNQFAVEIVS